MQDQRDVVPAGGGRRAAARRSGDADHSAAVHLERVDRNAAALGSLARRVRAFRRAEQDFCAGVFEVEAEFLFTVAGIEWSGRAGDGGGEEAYDRRQSIGQGCRHPVASTDAHRSQRIRHGGDLAPQRLVGDADS